MRSAKISELPFPVKRDGVPVNVIMNMGFIGMSTNKESVFTFEKTRGEIIPDLVCLLQCNLSGFERLAYLVNKYIVLFFFSGIGFVLPF